MDRSRPFRAAAAPISVEAADIGALPQWRLEDLYESPQSPRFQMDMRRAADEAKAFAAAYRGRLDGLANGLQPGERLNEAVRTYEALQDLMGRLMSYASLLYAGDTSDPVRAKFYGDTQEKITAISGDLLFFELELNRLDDSRLDAATRRSSLSHYRPWLDDIRKERPHQLADEIEKLFLEKSVTGVAAWNRLFDETVASLRFPFEGQELTLEPLLSKLQDP